MHYPNDELIDDGIFYTVAALKDRIFSKDCWPSLSDYDAWQQWQRKGAAKPERKRRTRKPSIRTIIKAAEKAGKTVTAVTTPEGVTLTFGEPMKDDKAIQTADNELEQWRRKKRAS
jgi:hypothetical protein